jgi:hypothetical protein
MNNPGSPCKGGLKSAAGENMRMTVGQIVGGKGRKVTAPKMSLIPDSHSLSAHNPQASIDLF